MLKYTVKRLAQSLVTILLIATIVFLLMRCLPTDYYFTEEQLMKFTEEQKYAALEAAGLTDPIGTQLLHFYNDLLHLDFGTSRRIQNGASVVKVIGKKFGVSMRLGLISAGISLLVGIMLGILQTAFKDKVFDWIGTAYTVFVNAVPSLVSYSLVLVFGSKYLGFPTLYSTRNVGPSSVLPIVLGIILMYWVDKLLKKIIPEMVRYFLKPLLTMLIVVPITLIVLGPIGTELSGVVGNALQAFFSAASIIATPVCSAIYPYLVMLGLDKAITPIMVEGISSIGYDLVVMPMGFISNLAVGGSALAVAMHLKDKGRKGMIASFGVTALCGVTEPAFYGSLIMRPRVLVGTAIGAAAGGLIAGIFQLKNYVVGGCPGFLSLLFFLPPDGSMGNMIVALASGIVTVVVAFIACTVILKKAYREDV